MRIDNRIEERTGFQEGKDYNPDIDLQTDFVIVYGFSNNLEKRIEKFFSDSLSLIAAASCIERLEENESGFSFIAYGPRKVPAVARFYCRQRPGEINLVYKDKREWIDTEFDWDEFTSTVLIYYDNDAQGVEVKIKYLLV